MNNKKNIYIIITLSALAFISRLIWHVPNFSPLASIVIFSAFLANNKKTATLPLLALLASDIVLGTYKWSVMLAVYLATALNIIIGYSLKKNPRTLNVVSASLFSAISFFLVTNLAVWASGDWYAKNFSGLVYCFALAIPFFKSTLASNILYSALIFSAYHLAKEALPSRKIIPE
jgi:hypothetical protein